MPAKGTVIVLPQDATPEQQQQQQASSALAGVIAGAPALPNLGGAMNPAPSSALVTRKDVDFLVQEIKENLKLGHYRSSPCSIGAGLGSGGGPLKASRASHLTHRGAQRASPYHVPPSSRVACDIASGGAAPQLGASGEPIPSQLKRWNQRRRYPSTCMAGGKKGDPDDPFQMLQELITDGSLIKEAVRRLQLGLSPKYNSSRSFYDSDEEGCRTPTPPPNNPAFPELCCEVVGGM